METGQIRRSCFSPYGQPSRNFITEFDQQVREKLIDQFDIKTITFLDEKVQSRGYGRTGRRETPLAYLLLQAKHGAVDRIPAFTWPETDIEPLTDNERSAAL